MVVVVVGEWVMSKGILMISPRPGPKSRMIKICQIGIGLKLQTCIGIGTGCPAKKFTFFKSAYLRPLISLRKSSILEMNLWISSFKSTKLEFSRIFRFRAIKGIRHRLHFSKYIWLTFEPSEMSNYSKMACIWPKIIIFQV